MSDSDGGVVQEILAKHGNSAQPESRQVVAILQATSEVIKVNGMQVSPISIFAASMSALERPETASSAQVTLSICTLLSFVLPRVPNSTLRSKFNDCSKIMCGILKNHKEQAAVSKAALHCLSQVLGALDPTNWPPAAIPFRDMLSCVMDLRPKVRKRAQQGLSEVLAALQGTPALGNASDAIAKGGEKGEGGSEGGAAAEEAITKSVQDTLHMIGTLKTVLPLMSGPAVKTVVDLLFKLYPLKQALLSRHTTEALTALCSAPSSHLAPQALGELLMVIVDADDIVWNRRDVDTVMSLTRLVESGFIRLHELDPKLCATKLPRAFHALVPQQDGVRFGTSQALRNLIVDCIDEDMVAAGGEGRAAAPIVSLIAAVTSLMGAMYQESWSLVMPVVGTLVEKLGACGGAELTTNLVKSLGAILAGVADADEGLAAGADGGMGAEEAEEYGIAAEAAMGAALRSLGPAAVMAVLPMQLKETVEGVPDAEARTWMLPLLRRHIRGAPLAYWSNELQPMARVLAAKAEQASRAHQTQMAQNCHMLELQIWHCLPAFVSWSPDLGSAYPKVVRRVLKAGGHTELIGYSEPIGCVALADDDDEEEPGFKGKFGVDEEETGHDTIPDDYTTEQALASADALRKWSKNLLPLRFKGSLECPAEAHSRPRTVPLSHLERAQPSHHNHPTSTIPPPQLTTAPHTHLRCSAQVVQELGPPNVQDLLDALRKWSKNWLPLMFKTFLECPAEARSHVAEAISAYCAVTDAATLAPLFRAVLLKLIKIVDDASKEVSPQAVLLKLIKIVDDASNEVPPPDMISEGGSDPVSRRCSFMELALCCSSGLDDVGLATLYKAAKPGLSDSEPAVQKKSYKVLAYICEQRPEFMCTHLADIMQQVVSSTGASLSASKRFRLRCLKSLALILSTPDCPDLGSLDTGDGSDSDEEVEKDAMEAMKLSPVERRSQICSTLVSEIVLCCKEPNKKTRTAAYGLLVELAHAMDDAMPSIIDGEHSVGDDELPMHERGGLYNFMTMVMAGIVGTTPHMISATVIALARLLFEFASQLQPMLPQLLPAVLMLLRTKSREVIKSVLGFVKVCAMRMPAEMLMTMLGEILEGVLIWCNDSKNKFKLKVRVIVERLARRCGFDNVAEKIPASEAKLLTHIRKEFNKKQRRRAGETGSQDGDDDGDDGKSQRSVGQSTFGARTAAASAWGHTQVFSEDGEDGDDGKSQAGRSTKSGRTQKGDKGVAGKAAAKGGARLFEGKGDGDDPMNLLDASASRQLVKTAAGLAQQQPSSVEDDYNLTLWTLNRLAQQQPLGVEDDYNHGDAGIIDDEDNGYTSAS
eukprot:gene31076-6203_t